MRVEQVVDVNGLHDSVVQVSISEGAQRGVQNSWLWKMGPALRGAGERGKHASTVLGVYFVYRDGAQPQLEGCKVFHASPKVPVAWRDSGVQAVSVT